MFLTGTANFDGYLSVSPQEGKTIEKRRFEVYAPYTPNVIKNLKDKPQPVRDDRHLAPGTAAPYNVVESLLCAECKRWAICATNDCKY